VREEEPAVPSARGERGSAALAGPRLRRRWSRQACPPPSPPITLAAGMTVTPFRANGSSDTRFTDATS
jgi:hypothetical protein